MALKHKDFKSLKIGPEKGRHHRQSLVLKWAGVHSLSICFKCFGLMGTKDFLRNISILVVIFQKFFNVFKG